MVFNGKNLKINIVDKQRNDMIFMIFVLLIMNIDFFFIQAPHTKCIL